MAGQSVAYAKPLAAEAAPEAPVASLRRNVSWTLVGNGAYAGCQLFMLMVLAKLGTPEMVGQFALAFALATPLFMLSNLQLRAVQATDARGEYAFRDYVTLRLASSVLAVLAVGIIVGIGSYGADTARIILLVTVAKAIESVSDVLYGSLQQREQMDRIAKSMILRGVLALAWLGLGIWLTGRLSVGVAGLIAAWLVVLVVYDLPASRRLARRRGGRSRSHAGDLRRIARLAWIALPLGFVMTLNSLNASLPRWFIERQLGAPELGVFMGMAYLIVVGTTIMSAFFQSASPRLSRYHADGNKAAFQFLLRRLVLVGAAVGGAGILVAVCWGREVLTLLYRPEFATRTDVFLWLMAVAALQYVGGAFSVASTSLRVFAPQAFIQVVATLLTLAVLVVAVPRYGLLGAAWALLAASLWSRLAFGLLLRTRLRTSWEPA